MCALHAPGRLASKFTSKTPSAVAPRLVQLAGHLTFSWSIVASYHRRVGASGTAWDRRIRRAEHLAAARGPAASLMTFYARVLESQKTLYGQLTDAAGLSGALAHDAPAVSAAAQPLVRDVAQHGPPPLAEEARGLLADGVARISDRLFAYRRRPSDRDFFAKAILQPYGERLTDASIVRVDRDAIPADNRCPVCGGPPQLSFLEPTTAIAGDGGSRSLLCASCLTAWPFRRVRCPSCDEDDERKLAYFHADGLEHLRVDACETCRCYVKTVDLTRLGTAVPLVDEVAGASLDLWARERGYEKIELNLVGL
jgi:formate dehydrogenase maturation protein FdhE